MSMNQPFYRSIAATLIRRIVVLAGLCLLAMTPKQVQTIMGMPEAPDDADDLMEPPEPSFEWPEQRTPESVFSLIQMKIRAGSTSAPNKLQQQEVWTKALPLLQQMIMTIRQIDAAGGDSSPERELLEETAARFDETLDVERFLPPMPPKPAPMPAMPQIPGVMPEMPLPGGVPGALPPTPLQ